MGGMAEEESAPRRRGFMDTLREGWKPPQRRAEDAMTTETATTERSTKPTEEVAAAKSGDGAATKDANGAETATKAESTGTKAAAAKAGEEKPPDPNFAERMEGLQGWMAELERKQRRTTLLATIGTVLALLAAGGAVYLGVANPTSASKDDFDDLEAQVETLQQQISAATADQNRLKQINTTLESLNARMSAAEQRASQTASQIAATKAQAQAAQQAATAAQQAAAATPPAPAPAPAPAPRPNPNP
jgi:chromosome segregation ATPase